MNSRQPPLSRTSVLSCVRPITAALLSVMLVCPAGLEAAGAKPNRKRSRAPLANVVLTPHQRALHLLNRLSFGPTPGQIEAVERVGVASWFEEQLHPERISDTAWESRLAGYPAMQLSQVALVERFPTPGMLRQYNSGRLTPPGDSTERAIYADAALSYAEKREARAAAKSAVAAQPESPGQVGEVAAAVAPAPVVRQRPAAVAPTSPGLPASALGDVEEKRHLLTLAPKERFQEMLSLDPDRMSALQAGLRGPEMDRLTEGMTPAEAESFAAMRSPERVVSTEVSAVRLLRDVYSTRQLQAVMTDFWLNHFNIFLRKNQNEPYLLPAFERDTVLPHALGHFEDLLIATAESPAMLVYLDNWESVGPNSRAGEHASSADQARPAGTAVPPGKPKAKAARGINENYARELMELHTLGVGGGYTQADVIEVARCFTGWTITRPEDGGTFVFNPNRHEPGNKVVLGHVIQESGMNEGLEVLHLLATQPATAHFLSRQLAQRFVSDTPPPALVERMSAAYLRSNGDLAEVLRVMVHSPEFWSSDVYRGKVKTPLEFVVSAVRASGAEVVRPAGLVQSLDRLGMPLYGMQTPNGYSSVAEDWVSSNALLTRMNFALVLSGGRVPGTRMDWGSLLGGGADLTTVPEGATAQRLEIALLGAPATPQTHDAALAGAATPGMQQQAEQQLRSAPGPSRSEMPIAGAGDSVRSQTGQSHAESPLATTAGLLLGSPDFQKR